MPTIIGVGVVVVVILIAVAMNMGGEPPVDNQDAPVKAATKEPEQKPAPVVKARSENYSAKMLKDPDTPAPAIAANVLSGMDTLYKKAKKLNDDARRAQAAGEGDKFNKLINDSWDVLIELEESIETYTMWLEEANMEDWRVPREYGPLQDRIRKLDTLKGRIKRVKPNRR